MYSKIITLLTVVLSMHTYAQTVCKGTVRDTNKNPLLGATVQSLNNQKNGVLTDVNGDFEITLKQGNEVTIRYMGFLSQTVKLNSGSNEIILTADTNALSEVVISASREEQLRSDVPASITSLSPKQIERSHAYGIEQLVNQAPGVYMSTAGASGNEQHMMAVRSPISTKAIFLYLEDGVPIRPTAIFNHNTLLEMNNTSFGRVEILKGPASSIYGSGAIGGSFNFITKKPTIEPSGSISFQADDLGITCYQLEYSQHANKAVGFYLGTHYIQRKNGPIEHSDYEKFAITFKSEVALSSHLKWTTVFDMINYRSDMTGSLSEADYQAGNYESDQTFSERKAKAFRVRTTFDQQWNARNRSSLNMVFRDNVTDQNPSYRITQFRKNGKLTGFGTGEVNSNRFKSYVAILQHKIDFDFAQSSLIAGISLDYTPQDYNAQSTDVFVDTETQKNIGFDVNQNDYILNYNAGIFNYAGYLQYEINPIKKLKITTALRYDKFDYNYNNNLDGIAGPRDSFNSYDNLSPKLGANYNFSKKAGIYANYAIGFTPPQTSTLYRNSYVGVGGEVFDLKPSDYYNYEFGGYLKPRDNLKIDFAFYLLDGKNTLITLRDENDQYFNANAGKTRSYGIEYGFTYFPFPTLKIRHSGSFAKHRYVNFFDDGIDYSDTERETAPSILGNSEISYRPNFIEGFSLTVIHELVGKYNTSFENQVVTDGGSKTTSTYPGHNVFNLRAAYTFKQFTVWAELLNAFDKLYAVKASYNTYQHANSYSIGNPRAFHAGIKYNIGK